jgi:hypothetical protein
VETSQVPESEPRAGSAAEESVDEVPPGPASEQPPTGTTPDAGGRQAEQDWWEDADRPERG